MTLRSLITVPRARGTTTATVALALSLLGCQAAPLAPADGILSARVNRARGTLEITNGRTDSVLVGVIGRNMAVSALRAPCGDVRIGPRRSAQLAIPTRETEAIVFYCPLPLPTSEGVPREQTFIVNLEN